MELSPLGSKFARFGLFEADLGQRVLTKGGLRVKLQEQPFQVLTLLLERPGEVVTREEIQQKLWPANTFVEFDDGLNTAIKKLRLALNDAADNPHFIETVPRRGYRFLAPVSFPVVEPQPKPTEETLAMASVVGLRERARIVIEDDPRSHTRAWIFASLLALGITASMGYLLHWKSSSQPARLKATAEPVSAVPPRRALAVLGFRNTSGNPEQAWLSTALAEMLSTELGAREKLRIVPEENIARSKLELSLADSDSLGKDTLSRLRADLGSDLVVLGSYAVMGSRGQEILRVNIRLQDAATGDILDAQSVSGKEGDLFELASIAGTRLREKLGIAELSSEEAVSLRASLPANALATQLYAEGLGQLRLYDGQRAREFFLKSIESDPNYALSHSALAQTWNMLGFDQRARDESKKALDVSEGLLRSDRLLIEGTYRESTKEWDRASETYKQLVDSCPDNPDYTLALARSLIAGGKPQPALAVLDEQSKSPVSAGDPRFDMARVQALLPTGDLKKAEAAAASAVEKAQRSGANLLLAQALLLQSGALLDLGDLERAIDLASTSEKIYSSVGNKFGIATATANIGSARWYQDKKEESMRVYRATLQLDEEIGNRRGSVEALSYIGAGLADEGDLAGARRVFEQAIAISHEINAQGGAAGALSEVAWTYLSEGDLVKARRLYEEALDLYRGIGSRIGEGNTLEPLGMLLISQGELSLAEKDLKQALEIARQNSDKISQCSTLRDLGILAVMRDEDPEARTTFKQAAELAAANGDSGETAFINMWLAKLDLDEGHASESARALADSKTVLQKAHQVGPELQASALAVEALMAQGKSNEAASEAQEGKRVAHQSPFFEEGLRFKIAIANLDASEGKTALARNDLSHVIAQAKAHGFPEVEFEARLAFGKLEIAEGNTISARAQLATLNRDATAKGYLLVARRAAIAATHP